MSYTFDFNASLINVVNPQTAVDCQDLINSIRAEEASANGIVFPQIASASGKESLGSGVAVGITVELLGNWQLNFWQGAYVAKVAGGNLVGGLAGDPVAYTSGVQVLLIQSAASTVVDTGSTIPTAQDNANALLDYADGVENGLTPRQSLRLMSAVLGGKISGSGTGTEVIRNAVADSKPRVTATVNESTGDRTTIVTDLN